MSKKAQRKGKRDDSDDDDYFGGEPLKTERSDAADEDDSGRPDQSASVASGWGDLKSFQQKGKNARPQHTKTSDRRGQPGGKGKGQQAQTAPKPKRQQQQQQSQRSQRQQTTNYTSDGNVSTSTFKFGSDDEDVQSRAKSQKGARSRSKSRQAGGDDSDDTSDATTAKTGTSADEQKTDSEGPGTIVFGRGKGQVRIMMSFVGAGGCGEKKGTIRTVFAREDDAVVERRKRAMHLPLVRCGGRKVDVYAASDNNNNDTKDDDGYTPDTGSLTSTSTTTSSASAAATAPGSRALSTKGGKTPVSPADKCWRGVGEGTRDGAPISPDFYQTVLEVPVRPPWQRGVSPEALKRAEQAYFNAYLTSAYERYGVSRLNHFEHNLDVWRQLWRVCERSDILVLVCDARHPLLHFNAGMYRHVTQVLKKPLILLLNKIDLVPLPTLRRWQAYFHAKYPDMHVVLFSSYPSAVHRLALALEAQARSKEASSRAGGGGGGGAGAGARDYISSASERDAEALQQVLAAAATSASSSSSSSSSSSTSSLLSIAGSGALAADIGLAEHAKKVAKSKKSPMLDPLGTEALLAACRDILADHLRHKAAAITSFLEEQRKQQELDEGGREAVCEVELAKDALSFRASRLLTDKDDAKLAHLQTKHEAELEELRLRLENLRVSAEYKKKKQERNKKKGNQSASGGGDDDDDEAGEKEKEEEEDGEDSEKKGKSGADNDDEDDDEDTPSGAGPGDGPVIDFTKMQPRGRGRGWREALDGGHVTGGGRGEKTTGAMGRRRGEKGKAKGVQKANKRGERDVDDAGGHAGDNDDDEEEEEGYGAEEGHVDRKALQTILIDNSLFDEEGDEINDGGEEDTEGTNESDSGREDEDGDGDDGEEEGDGVSESAKGTTLSTKSLKRRARKEKRKQARIQDLAAQRRAFEAARARRLTIGTIGHPNAGKSSVINALTGKKVVSVSRQPGHTKILQTLLINDFTVLCDCPGLVFPAVDMPRELQVLSGIYPIPQTREPFSAIQYLAECVPLEDILGLVPPPSDAESAQQHKAQAQTQKQTSRHQPTSSSTYPWSAWTLCEAYAIKRGFLVQHGRPDANRAAQQILYAVADGKIPFYFEPPALEEERGND